MTFRRVFSISPVAPHSEAFGSCPRHQVKRDFEKQYCGARSIKTARSLNPELQTFDEWLECTKGLIQAQLKPAGVSE
jgi:hypothetical protein